MHEADTILPWTKDQGKLAVNKDFAKRYPDKLKDYFYPGELRTQGYEKLVEEKNDTNTAS